MRENFKLLAIGLGLSPAIVGALWLLSWAAGGPWAAPVGALICLPLLLVTWREGGRL